MPMFREDDRGHRARRGSRGSDSSYPDSAPILIQTPPGMGRWLSHRLSEESIRTELCEGPLPDSPPKPATPQEAVPRGVSDRAEFIERLKRGESPTWVPNRHLESLFKQNTTSSPPRTPQPADPSSPGLLPAPTLTPDKQDACQTPTITGSPLRDGLSIGRPRSALHSGNFTPVDLSPGAGVAGNAAPSDAGSHFRSAHVAWTSTSPPRDYAVFDFAHGTSSYRREAFKSGPSSLSSSLSSTFVYKPPTSPLVQSESNEELDLTLPLNSFSIDANSPRSSRRHTLNLGPSPFADAASHRQSPLRRESTYPYQAHQPGRSLSSTRGLLFPGTSPQTPSYPGTRRPSFGSEASSLQHASMVGSYEESILRGRMSTTPSKPLEFTAQIGVLGLGKCKASLRCPSHVTLPFAAVFYNYGSTTSGGSKAEDGPSPYVGQIDLENGLPNLEEGQRTKRKLQSRYQDMKGAMGEGFLVQDGPADVSDGEGPKSARPKRPSRTPKAPPGGGYRIPEKGQLQIIIKNQNKTAVKLFLIPYDLAGMEPGTKTFIRQRSYSAGPIMESEVPATQDAPATGTDRPTLRYLIHLHICCPSKGRYYLYKSIRVVFANRVPDGKERLRNEVTYPDPRFTPYKPIRVMHPPLPGGHAPAGILNSSTSSTSSTISPSAALAAERAFRRRSAGFALGQQQQQQQPPYLYHHHQFLHAPETATPHHHPTHADMASQFPHTSSSQKAPGQLSTTTAPATTIRTTTATATVTMPGLEMTGRSTPMSSATTTSSSNPSTYDKLNRGDAGYGGGDMRHPNSQAVVPEGLLSQRLRSLGVEGQQQPQQHQPEQQPQQYRPHQQADMDMA